MHQNLRDILTFLWTEYPLQQLAVALRIPATAVVVNLCWREPAVAPANLVASRSLYWQGKRIGVIDVFSRTGSHAELLAALDAAEAAIERFVRTAVNDERSAAA